MRHKSGKEVGEGQVDMGGGARGGWERVGENGGGVRGMGKRG